MQVAIIDGYTDEPSGLGVPPFLGTYPRYVFGSLIANKNVKKIYYLTVDDLRLFLKYNSKKIDFKKQTITDISVYNLTLNYNNVLNILTRSDVIIFILGSLTPGKYLSAKVMTVKELKDMLNNEKFLFRGKKILFGPIAFGFGSSNIGGRVIRDINLDKYFDLVVNKEDYIFFSRFTINDINKNCSFTQTPYKKLRKFAILGSSIVDQIDREIIVELELYRGCTKRIPCSFCVEKLKSKIEFREPIDVIDEVKEFVKKGIKHFRIGKQTCFYDYFYGDITKIEQLLREIRKFGIKTLHIDNVNPNNVIKDNGEEITKLIVKYCTSGNTASFGVESLDPLVIEKNNLLISKEKLLKAIRIINRYGREIGENGLPKFLPGLNFLFGLIGETKRSFDYVKEFLEKLLEEDLWIRRVNVREVVVFKNTLLEKLAGNKYLRKNKKYYYKWRRWIREKFDNVMLKRIAPVGRILKDCYAEIYKGNTTFLRQFGSYPLVIGVKRRLELRKYYDVKVKSHMLRSLVADLI